MKLMDHKMEDLLIWVKCDLKEYMERDHWVIITVALHCCSLLLDGFVMVMQMLWDSVL